MFSGRTAATVLSGQVTDLETGEPIVAATVRIEGTGYAMPTNDQGEFRLRLPEGTYRIKVSHITHYSERTEVVLTDSAQVIDFSLRPSLIEISGIRVFDKAYDPAQQIIVEAIKRKGDILRRIQKFSCDAYTKVVFRDVEKDDSCNVILIAESQVDCTWEYPDKYNEVIVARKQTANIGPEGNLLSVGEILNFNENRIEIGTNEIVSPTAEDALDYYNYYLLDTLMFDNRRVFHIEIEPKNPNDRLFVGTVDIVDSTFSVVGVDVGMSKGVELTYVHDVRYTQVFAEFEGEYWLPIEIGLSGELNLPIPGIPKLSFDYKAALHEYDLHPEIIRGLFDFAIEVAETADDVDSITWADGQMVPLTPLEDRGYRYQDSLASAPKPIGKTLLRTTLALTASALINKDLFRFNRVEGAYVGLPLGYYFKPLKTDLSMTGGYSFGLEKWQFRSVISNRFGRSHPVRFWATYLNQVVGRQSLITTEHYNPTFVALMLEADPFDYFGEEGFRIGASMRVFKPITLGAGYNHVRQYSLDKTEDYSVFGDEPARHNPVIADGHLRSFDAFVEYDSRPIMKLKRREARLDQIPRTYARIEAEYASPDLIDNDFDFVRYEASFMHSRTLLGLGITRLYLAGGLSDRSLPPQKYFTVDFNDIMFSNRLHLNTLDYNNFVGSRMGLIALQHDFGNVPFRKSGIPGFKRLPFSLSVYAGAFWSDLENNPVQPGDDLVLTAPKAYTEVGFSIGRIPPLGLKMLLTWQLSDYNTADFNIGFDLDLFGD
ncbi:MAG TPA: DUF5686 family protein [candidate division Zixibacteria bacterium]|nr:DUF5686 family protein [candidate division Zixibacteria bacterium]